MKYAKTLLCIATALAAVLPAARAWEEGKLLIWINGDKGYRGLQQVGDKFAKELGVPVKVEAPEGVTDKFFQAAQSGKGPDIFMWPHDRLGEWADAGILKPVDIDAATKARIFPKAWDAFTHKNRIWAYPMSLEALGLIYNTKLVTGTPPTNLDDVIKLAPDLRKKGITPIMWDYGTPFFSWGFLASDGGYVYKRGASGYDLNDVGVNAPGAIKALEQIVDVINQGIMPKGTTYSVMESKMNSGELAMMVSGPWAWGNLRKSNIPFAVAPMLGANGKPGKPFVGVLGAMINRSSPNADLAEEFLKNHLLTDDGLRTMNADVPLGVPALESFYKELSKDPAIAATKASVDAGELMPNIPEMGRFWSSLQAALSNATNGQSTPREALDHAAARMKDGK
ncbi:maltose-binding periplasmic protein [Opitutaceae bacterium TAV1]|nr:maltose-binding periplasmic protein [Opitutaceae bacterium TAV1]